jgi:hypothetical protein
MIRLPDAGRSAPEVSQPGRTAPRADIGEIETDPVQIKQPMALEARVANVSGRVDRLAGNVALIKRWLDLTETP